MPGNFNDEAQYILLKAKNEMLNLNHPYIGTEHLVLSILKTKNSLSERLEDYGLTYNKFKTEILTIIGKGSKKSEFFLYTPLLKKVIENSMLDAKDNNNGEVTPEHLFSSLLEVGEGIAIRIFIGMGIDIDDLYENFSNKLRVKNKKSKRKLLINELGRDLVEKATQKKLDPAIGREKEIQRLIEILCRRCKNNPLLIGKAGVGKTALLEEYIKYAEDKGLKVLKIAPTGLAASNFGGQTAHSKLKLSLGVCSPSDGIAHEVLFNMAYYDVIVIDEVGSMRFDYFSMVARMVSELSELGVLKGEDRKELNI